MVIKVGGNSFWDLMSYSEAASELGCSVADFAKSGLPSARLACFVSNGDPSTKTVGAMHAEFDDSRKMIRVQFGQAVSSFLRINWMLALNGKA